MALLDALTGHYIDRYPADSWVVVCDHDKEWVAVRHGHPTVMTRGCKDSRIAKASNAEEVVSIVREWLVAHPADAAADRLRVCACHRANESLRLDHLATEEAIQRRIAAHEAECKMRGEQPHDRAEVASNVTVAEVEAVRQEMISCECVRK